MSKDSKEHKAVDFNIEYCLKQLAESLGKVFTRRSVGTLTNGAINPKTLANIMSDPDIVGPPSFKIGRTVCFETQSFIAWLVASGRITLNKEKD